MLLLAAASSDTTAQVTAAPILKLPWARGERMYVLQGIDQGTHTGFYSKYAYDFAPDPVVSKSFTVRAAAPGKVLEVAQDFPDGSCDPALSAKTNYVLIDHGGGVGTMYLHLARGSAVVKVGATVASGEPLGQSGRSGYVCGGAHLHFTAVDIKTRQSLDIPFSDPDTLRDGGRPKNGQWYISDNGPGSYTVRLPYVVRRSLAAGP